MKRLLWPIRILYTTYALALFVVMMLVVFPFVVVASFWGRIRGGNFVFRVLRIWSVAWFTCIGIRHRNIYRYRPDRKQQYIFVANHISYLDAAVIVDTFRQPFRPLGKAEMARIPIFGYIYRICVVVVQRDSAESRSKSVRQLKSVLKRGISILVFPEGTFNETGRPLKDFYEGAFRVAIETQTPVLPVVFPDTYSRMPYHHMFTLNPGQSRAIFLDPIPVEGLTLQDVPGLKDKVFQIMSEQLVELKAAWIGHPEQSS
jgi:1-acyl-sn-glycerol-3-phosphate acyltransferase